MVQVIRNAVRKLGYSEKILYMDKEAELTGGPGRSVKYGLTRFTFKWEPPKQANEYAVVTGEVDGNTKVLKSLYIDNYRLNRPSPKVVEKP
jgi:hypothetical protein